MNTALVFSDHVQAWFAGRSPIIIARRSTLHRRERNGFELGRDYERSMRHRELSTVATMLSAIQEGMTTGRTR